jgi:outer membrane protein OmpA-like peptidoglycan-associated protein
LVDTHGDSVLDKDDKCHSIKGLVSNSGCPVVDTAVLKKLNDFYKSILFDSGKSTIKQESTTNIDEIVKVMSEYGSANFKLEGYTDNTGVVANNLKLSKDRAAAVKAYLISKGISANRLSSEGYGIIKPIADNKTVAGRTLNRRVEIILMK